MVLGLHVDKGDVVRVDGQVQDGTICASVLLPIDSQIVVAEV